MVAISNTYYPSQLVSQDIMNLLGQMESPILKTAGRTHTGTFDDKNYSPGMSVGFHVSGIPTVSRSNILQFSSYEQRILYITADVRRWQFSVSHTINQEDDVFFMNRKLLAETISAPSLKAIKEKIEYEGARYAAEHSPVIPTYGAAINAEITLPTAFDSKVTNYLQKLRRDLIFPADSYKLILNTRDDMEFANSLVNTYSTQFVESSVKRGAVPKMISDFQSACSPYLGLHKSKLGVQARGPLRFVSYPTSEQNPVAVIKNMSGADIILTGGDILYHVANDTLQDSGVYWIQNTIKKAIPDSRYAFVVTSDKYISEVADAQMPDFKYEDVEYLIPNNGELEISLSHMPIFSGYHQNCSRQILTGDTGDQFYVLGDHFKNHALHPEYFKFKCFPLTPLKSTEHATVDDGKTGVKMLITYDRIFAEGSPRGNVFDISSLPCFGAVSQNLFTLPVGEVISGNLENTVTVSMAETKAKGKQKK